MQIKKNACYEVEIIDINNEGNGVAKTDGFVIFVPMTAVGDIVKVKIVKVMKSFAYGIVESIITLSHDRIEGDCPHFNQCGGCSLRHISYQAESMLKRKFVSDCFERIGDISVKVDPLVENENIYYYRNKAQYPLAIKNSKAIAGFYARRSHRVIKCSGCRLQPEVFQHILNCVLDFINEYAISVYDEISHSGLLRNVYIRYGEKTGEIMVCLVSTKKIIPHIAILIERLLSRFKNIVSIMININPKQTNVILGEICETIYGKSTITDILCGLSFEISPLSFYQINPAQAEKLYNIAAKYANLSGNECLLDFYCGTGTIGLSMAHKVKQLIGIEIIPQAVENAKRNALWNGITNAEFICADAKESVQKLKSKSISPDVVLLDPPRKGCEKSVLDNICDMKPERIVMISCNPATAARDCKYLKENGFEVVAVTPVDLFSRTTHVETCVLLSHKKPDSHINV